jgi:hypothetical protein
MLFSRKGSTKRKVSVCIASLCALFAIAGPAANAAQAAVHWNIAGSPLGNRSETFYYSGGPWYLNASALGTTIEMEASLECVGVFNCKIEEGGATTQSLEFKEVKVLKPSKCSAGTPGSPNTIVLNPLHGYVSNSNGTLLETLDPAHEVVTEIEFTGPKCTLVGNTIPVKDNPKIGKGPILARLGSPLGVEKRPQEIISEGSPLNFGGGVLRMIGSAKAELNGSNAGKLFGVAE